MPLDDFLDAVDGPRRSLVVVNRSQPRPIQAMLEDTFSTQAVGVEERALPDADDDVVLLVEETADGPDVVASSPLSELMNTVLLVNSDLYKTGTKDVGEFELPAVLTGLDDVQFRLRGYPESNKEKLLLISVSRYIEGRAVRRGAGTLRSSFQRLSRIEDERGTRAVYETLAFSDVGTHVYGMPDWDHPVEFGVTSHGGYTADFRDSWFVVYTPPDGSDDGHVALLALEVEPRRWVGYWTFRRSLVTDIDDYVAHNM